MKIHITIREKKKVVEREYIVRESIKYILLSRKKTLLAICWTSTGRDKYNCRNANILGASRISVVAGMEER